MTTYGTIPTASSSPGSSSLGYISRAKERIVSGLGTRRPWKEMVHRHAIGIPGSFPEAVGRVRTNVGYFLMNYVIIVLVVLFLSLLWHPISLIVFVVMMAAWLFLYFLRDEPLVILSRTVNDRVVLIVLSIVTIVLLLLTHATLNILVSLLIGVVVVLVHGVLRKTDDLFGDEESARSAGLLATGDETKRPLQETSSSSS
ncbi:PREDICTED: PRA1 family protein F3-like [Nelumbo nucifera]|uniref:PRA1 family protein n=1 Tax=Nelumbo nucifera TaxID=4432 RepID=A0A1U7YQ61_NELNU|nr:PREDICTED: PRA1 family protein F3-like [Nelumbo nucifera]